MKRTGTLLVALFLGVFLGSHCEATVYYSDGSAASVQYLHDNLAQNGDTITIPAGTFTWSSPSVTFSKNITIQGAGLDATTLTGNDLLVPFIRLGTTASTVTGIRFVLTGTNANALTMISAQGQNFRVHHNKFENGGGVHTRIGVLCTGDYDPASNRRH